jgi:DNA-binding PadR family transcriptional regulator
MYELIILGCLMRHPAHGYLIAKIINDVIGPYARVSNGRLYPLLARLEQAGLIATHTESVAGPYSERQLHSYEITEEGKKRFYELMMNTSSALGEYQRLFWQKSTFFDLLEPVERLHLIDHYIGYSQAHIYHHTQERDDVLHNAVNWREGPGQYIETIAAALQHTIDQWQLEFDWAKSLRAKEEQRMNAGGSEKAPLQVEDHNGLRHHTHERTPE